VQKKLLLDSEGESIKETIKLICQSLSKEARIATYERIDEERGKNIKLLDMKLFCF
jgi:hypothetical protein